MTRLRGGTRRRVLVGVLTGAALAACSSGTPAAAPAPTTAAPAPTTTAPPIDPAAPTGWGPTQGEYARAGALAAALTVEARAATVLMPGFWGQSATAVPAAEATRNRAMHGVDTPRAAVADHRYGGVFLKTEVISNAGQVRSLVDGLHGAGDGPDRLPLLISVDQEGGSVQRIREGVTRWPSATAVGRTNDPELAERIAAGNGAELRALGVTMVMAPVADVNTAHSDLVGTRSFGADPAAVTRMVTASVRGYLAAGIVPVVKHFPGHGSVTGDSHSVLPVQSKSVAALTASDLVPFAGAIAAGVPVIMTAHIAVTAVDPKVPASVSPKVVTGLLRDRLGFRGVVVTDSQGMAPIDQPYASGEGAVRSLLAGNDLVLNSPRPTQALAAVVTAARTGRLPEKRLTEAATRVLALRIYQQRIGKNRPPTSVLRSAAHLAAAASVP